MAVNWNWCIFLQEENILCLNRKFSTCFITLLLALFGLVLDFSLDGTESFYRRKNQWKLCLSGTAQEVLLFLCLTPYNKVLKDSQDICLFSTHPAVAAACLRSSRRFLLAGCLTSRPVSRSRWCCHCRPGAVVDEYPSSPSPLQCTRSSSCEGPAPPVSYLL